MADTASFSAAMKTKFIGPIRDHLPKGKVLLFGDKDANPTDFKGILPKAEGIDFVGNEFRIPFKSKRNPAVGFRAEGGTLPAPSSSEYTYLSEPLRYEYAVFSISGQLLKAAESNEGAFRSAFKAEMEDTLLSTKLDVNRAAYGDGSGNVATVRTNESSGAADVDVSTTINFRGGEIIDFVAANGTVISAGHTVTSIDRAGRNIGISPVLGDNITTSHFAVRASSDSSVATPNNSQNQEIQGLSSIVSDTGTVHGINPATYPWWKSHVQTGVGAISDSVLRDAKDAVGFEQGLDVDSDGLDFALITTRGVRRRYADTLTSVKRFNDASSVKLHGGFTALYFDENPIFVDDQCQVGTLYGLALRRLFWAQMSDWEWMDEDGKVLHRQDRKDRYSAVLYKYCNLGTTQRGAHLKLTGLNDDTR